MQLAQKISSESFRFLEDAERSLVKWNKEIDELLSLQKLYIKQTAAMFLEVKLAPGPKLSPAIPTNDSAIKPSNMSKLRENYSVVEGLWAAREELERTAVTLRQAFAHRGDDLTKFLAEVEKTKHKINLGLKDAFEFLAGLAKDHMPAQLDSFNSMMGKILQKSIAYEDSSTYTYVYEVEGDPCFSTYFHLKQVVDDDGTYYSEMFFVTTYRTGNNAGRFVAVLQKFVPPSERLLTKRVETVKDTTRAINMLLAMDNFTTSIGSLPIALMLKDSKIDRELFLYQNYVQSIRVDEEQIVIMLKPEIQDKSMADKILNQMYLDFQGIVGKTGAKVRMAVKKAEKLWILTFFFVKANDTLMATEDDLSFMKERFNLSDTTLKSIVRTINQGS